MFEFSNCIYDYIEKENVVMKMRRANKEVKNWNEIMEIIRRSETIRLGIHAQPFPYVVPVSFGYEEVDGVLFLYIHGAAEGYKHTLLKENNNVCVEADILHRYVHSEAKSGSILTADYESVIGFGVAEPVFGDEAKKGIDLICSHCGYHGFECNNAILSHIKIYKITLQSITGKKRFEDSEDIKSYIAFNNVRQEKVKKD